MESSWQNNRKNRGSSTRYYEPFVFEQMLNIRTQRGLEFSIEEIQKMLSSSENMHPFNSYRLWDAKQQELIVKINELQSIVCRLSEMKRGDYYWQLCHRAAGGGVLPLLCQG